MNFQYINLVFSPNCIGYGGRRLTLGTVSQFLETLEKHFNPSKGYFYTAMPTGAHVTGAPRLRNEFDSLPVLKRLRKHLAGAENGSPISISHQESTCSFCNGLHSIPPTIISTHVRLTPGDNSLDTLIESLLTRSAKTAFIDPFLRLTPGCQAKRFADWINACPRLTHIAFIRGDNNLYDNFIGDINLLRNLVGDARWDALHIRAFSIRTARARMHARYIHTDQFTLGVEGGFQFDQCGADEMTNVYLVGPHHEVDDRYIINRPAHFTTISAWDKPPNGGNTLQAADRNLPSFAP